MGRHDAEPPGPHPTTLTGGAPEFALMTGVVGDGRCGELEARAGELARLGELARAVREDAASARRLAERARSAREDAASARHFGPASGRATAERRDEHPDDETGQPGAG